MWSVTALVAMIASPLIVIDPGHPSENGVGTRGQKLTEIHVAWMVANELRVELLGRGYRVRLTKSKEQESVTNRRRAEFANAAKADLMLRLHCDAASGSGIGVYYPAEAGKAGGQKGPSEQVRKESGVLAKKLHTALTEKLRGLHADRGLMTDRQTAIGRRQGALTGSIFSKVPVILVELCVLTNPKDEAWVASREGRARLVAALALGVEAAAPIPK
ncbi:MAG: N-acetylmuramoyl-L-alanine amidase [Armatimonadetes bacterium]|nr:N-acetylmuramoyl-L-alanine amidase [Armatimonadota bacterium]